jgi:pimeloyl-[acyl-carrier protein] methyl ester esterase
MTELIFIHGWGFDARFWDPLTDRLSDIPQRRVDLGFFDALPDGMPTSDDCILIGHSLGFMHGLLQKKNWAGWVAINSFARFVPDCVPAPVLREMCRRMGVDPRATLDNFYGLIGAGAAEVPHASPNVDTLRAGLDELRDGDVTSALRNLKVPGLVLASRNDPLVPEVASQALFDVNPSAKISWHETGGHMLPMREVAWFAQAINKFLSLLQA